MRVWRWLALWLCVLPQACSDPDHGPSGMACARDADCGELVCAAALSPAPADLAALPLACSPRRPNGAAPTEPCADPRDCDRGVCLLAGACASSCESAVDCAEGQRCQAVYARSGAGHFAELTACVATLNLPRDARVLQERLAGAANGGIDTLTLPPLAAQTLYVLEHLDDASWPVPPSRSTCRAALCARSLRTRLEPEQRLFDADTLDEDADGPELGIGLGKHVRPLTVWVPNGPRVAAAPRAYELEVESTQPGDLQLTAATRPERGARLDLNLYYVGARGLAPEGERGPPSIASALEEVDRIFEPAEIFLGEVRQTLVGGAMLERGAQLPGAAASAGFRVLRSQYQVLPQLPELFKLSAGAANVALDLFLVAEIDAQGGADVGGIAGGTPVAFGMHGTPGSGIAIATDMFLDAGDPVALGRVLAHELGHALGLFHTTEVDGVVVDPLPDTPVCSLTQDRDRSGSLDAQECAAHGGDNLMFSTSDAGSQLTPQQREVLRSALVLR